MSTLYVKEQGALIQKRGERIVVTRRTATLLDLPVFQIDNLMLFGNVQLSTQALHLLMESGVDVSYFSYSGRYLGHTAAESSKNIFLRFEQYRFYTETERRMETARQIVANKIDNQLCLLQQYQKHESDETVKDCMEKIGKNRKSLPEKQTSNELMGVEGICSSLYFTAFSRLLKCDFTFSGRNRRPPRDPVNVMLSLTYTFLTKEVSQYLDAESFETYLGILHGLRYGRKSLALDIVEEFRQPVGDRLVLTLFNKHMISKYDFEFPDDGSVILNEDGFKKFCREYERWMTGKNSLAGERSFRGQIRGQTAKLKKAICDREVYSPYNWREHSTDNRAKKKSGCEDIDLKNRQENG